MRSGGSVRIRFALIGALLAAGAAGEAAWAQPDPRYWDLEEVTAQLDAWALAYPHIFHREIIGHTLVDQEPIWAVKISDNAAQPEPEARVLIKAAMHGNEANGTNAIMFMLDRLLTRYGQSPYYTNMVDNLEMWFVPILNVDGFKICFSGGPNWSLWRKTKRDNNGDGQYTYPHDGVDPNRNWDYRWQEYAETNPSSLRYKGPYPWSEPEIVVMRDLILRERPVLVMDLHSPDVPSIGNKIWWVWYDPSNGQYSPDADIFQPISIALGNRCETETSGVYVNGSGPSYNELPKEQCWVYKNTGICAFLMEISLQYWWTGATVDTIAARTGRGLFYLMERALTGPGVKGIVSSAGSGAPLRAQVVVSQVHSPTIGPRLTEESFGQYWRLLLSGNYTVTASAPGHQPLTQSAYVGSGGWTTLNFALQPDPASGVEGDLSSPRLLWADAPLRGGGSVYFRLEEPGRVSLRLLDATGRRVATLLDGEVGAGVRAVPVGGSLPSGSYLLLLKADPGIRAAGRVVWIE
ncbi:MAG: carboxypeptidase regulatory-like domain-containing protein [Candidatus Eisenbacteria bacterium]|uniref:Carboxypeptidase regulatory-like domain-containing protein n=1 Tax=Eiseniibacteriota bacterium TaxID=2212470 RepID=A0A938BN40_UNCEI|nr:carboxypeptidase regulatory-like domain-containing protein [Candidatus Eisenbacteria bacterium]